MTNMKSLAAMFEQIKIWKNTYAILLLFLMVMTLNLSAQEQTWPRDYTIGIYNQYDLRNSSENGITTHRILNDAFRNGLNLDLEKTSGKITYGTLNFASTFFLLVWSHEFGHSLRAKQVGGYFKIHNANIPVPYTTMHLPEDISLVNEALAVTGGFEVNYLTVRSLQQQFITQNGIYNEDLGLSFAHRIFYPLYTSLIVPIDPEDKEVWKNTPGDPANIALLVYRNYSNDEIFIGTDSAVNPGLVKFYQQSALLGTFFNLTDPQFYKEIAGSFGNSKKSRRPIFIIGDYHNGWTYGTLFNTSPLGDELYFNNYLHLNDKKFSFYYKYGFPFKNNGIGIGWYGISESENYRLSGIIEAWDQDIFGQGISGELSFEYSILDHLGIKLNLGYKTEGYLLGKQTNEGANLGFSLTYRGKY